MTGNVVFSPTNGIKTNKSQLIMPQSYNKSHSKIKQKNDQQTIINAVESDICLPANWIGRPIFKHRRTNCL